MNHTKMIFAFALSMIFILSSKAQTTEITTTEAASYYSDYNVKRVSVHDPSIVYDSASKQYYIFGSHRAVARTSDLQNWTNVAASWGKIASNGQVSVATNDEAFVTNMTKSITKGGQTVAFGNYDCKAWMTAYNNSQVDGNMWAPDVIYNPVMKKWCQYLSLNGPTWNSAIVLLTADQITGPYVYQGPVVMSGFINNTNQAISYKKTDLEIALGTQSTLPSRYARGNDWGKYWPHAIDPCVFYDEEGSLWMSYGSWSGGIWILKLNKENGLRDYDAVYPSDYASKGVAVTSDPYFGKKIAGGVYVSGEASYIEHINKYYYLFVTYGGLEAKGGYQMRVFRSLKPDGPYTDVSSNSAIFNSYQLNYGPNSVNRGENILGSYANWGFMGDIGETAQGHNSIVAAADGNTYLVYHTRFNNGTEGHQVRVHQVFTNKLNWLVAAPFEYHGEQITDKDISTRQLFTADEIAGTYKVLVHRYRLDHKNLEMVKPQTIVLTADGKVTGDYTGTWSISDGTTYLFLNMDNTVYHGVFCEQQMDKTTIKALAFTACSLNGVNVWGYKMRDDYSVAYQINNTTMPLQDKQVIKSNISLQDIALIDNVKMEVESSKPDILSDQGLYNPASLAENTPLSYKIRFSSGNYFWSNTYSIVAQKETMPTGDWLTGMVAYYNFNDWPFANVLHQEQQATLQYGGNNHVPTAEMTDYHSSPSYHQNFGASGNESFATLVNPLYSATLDGFSIAFNIRRNDDNLYDDIFSFYDKSTGERLFFTPNCYIGYNDGKGNWIDMNKPDDRLTNYLPQGKWVHVVLALSRSGEVQLYIDGVRKFSSSFSIKGSFAGKDLTNIDKELINKIIDFVVNTKDFYLGYGSFWGSADVNIDDLLIYNRVLGLRDVSAVNLLAHRVFDYVNNTTGIAESPHTILNDDNTIYDLMGRKVIRPGKGIYIRNGKKIIY